MKASVIGFNKSSDMMSYFKIRFDHNKETKILLIDTHNWYYKRKEIKEYIKNNWSLLESEE